MGWKSGKFEKKFDQAEVELCSVFYSGLVSKLPFDADYSNCWRLPERQKEILKELRQFASDASIAGCKNLISGVPMRKEFGNDRIIVDESFKKDLGNILKQMAEIAVEFGMKFLIHTEANSTVWTASDIQDIFSRLPDYVGFCPDTAQTVGAGENPVHVVSPYYSKVSLFHWKDCKGIIPFDLDGTNGIFIAQTQYTRPIGQGDMDNVAWSDFLKSRQYDGWAVFEIPCDVGIDVIRETILYGKNLIK